MLKLLTKPRADGDFWLKASKTLRHYGWLGLRLSRGVLWDMQRLLPVRPVFILGCSRAGTTLVYKTFSESLELGTLQRETHDFWASLHPLPERDWNSHRLDAAQASDKDRDQVARYFFSFTGRRRFADKNNQNSLCVPYLHALFPDAYFVYVKRNPGDNINSLIEGWHRPEEFASWSSDLPAKVTIDSGAISHWCFFLPDGWRDYLDAPLEAVCAFQYCTMNKAILAARAEIPARQWVEIFYEDLLADPVAGFQQAFHACELRFTASLETHCATVLSRPYNAFSAIRQDKWRDSPNRERIERVLPVVADVSERMGYADSFATH